MCIRDSEPGNREVKVKVVFKPSSNSPVNETVTVVSKNADGSNGDNSPQVTLRGKGAESIIKLSIVGQSPDNQQTVKFDPTDVKDVKTKTIEVENTGDATLRDVVISIGEVSPTGTTPFKYSSRIFEIPKGGKDSFEVSFTPTQSGAASAILSVQSNAANKKPELELLGDGRSAHMEYSHSSIPFGSVKRGQPSATKNLIIRNQGKAALRITQITTSNPDFVATLASGQYLPVEIPADGGDATVVLTFTPSGRGTANGELQVFSNASNTVSNVTLTGMGLDGIGRLSPA